MKTDEIIEGGFFVPEYYLDSGSHLFNRELTHKGIPAGSLVHLYSGGEGSFKTSLALHGARAAQEAGFRVGFVDAEKSFDPEWASNMGVSTDKENWVYAMPSSGEKAFEFVESMIKDFGCKVVILDSIDAAQPEKYNEEDYGDAVMMVHAKLVNKFSRRIGALIKDHQAIVYVINQMRAGGGGHMVYNVASGGKGLPFYSTINVEMARMKSPSTLVGLDQIDIKLRIRRSKMGRSFRDIETIAVQGVGFDRDAELVKLAIEKGLIVRSGSWYKLAEKDEKGKQKVLGQHIDLAKEWAVEHKEEIL